MLDRPLNETTEPWPSADPLGEALHFLRMSGAFYGRSELTAPWGITLPPMPGYLWFHVVTSGRGWLEGKGNPTQVGPGDLALVPHGEGHVLRSEPDVPAPGILELEREQVSERYEILRHGDGGAPTTLICGAVRFDHPAARNLVEILPDIIHIEASSSPRMDWTQSTLRLVAAEAEERRPGGEAVITRLADILVIQAIRSWIETDPAAQTGWLGALHDRQIGHAISMIHRDPARAWTVAFWPTRSQCRAQPLPPASPPSSTSPPCSTSHAGACTWPSARFRTKAPLSASFRAAWAIAQKRPSRERSSA